MTPGMGDGVEGGPPRVAMAMAMAALLGQGGVRLLMGANPPHSRPYPFPEQVFTRPTPTQILMTKTHPNPPRGYGLNLWSSSCCCMHKSRLEQLHTDLQSAKDNR